MVLNAFKRQFFSVMLAELFSQLVSNCVKQITSKIMQAELLQTVFTDILTLITARGFFAEHVHVGVENKLGDINPFKRRRYKELLLLLFHQSWMINISMQLDC